MLDLFSGIGGMTLGLERAGMKTIGFCESDAFCRRVLQKHWPNTEIHDDVRTLDGRAYRGTIGLVCGGFPCQPYSLVGERSGDGDYRALWGEMLRVVQESGPAWVIGENVVGLETMGLDRICADLEHEGYALRIFDLPASGVGARHERRRLYIVAHSSGEGLQRFGSAGVSGRGAADGYPWESAGWYAAPRICRGDDGIPDRVDRLRALGNAVVPQVVEVIGRAIMEC